MRRWKTISVFISSTFKDLQLERDIIARFLAPQLNDSLEPYHIKVNFIDLRSGIDTTKESEAKREQKVLEVCINEIHKSRPFFIGIIGGRYGWIPEYSLLDSIEEHLTLSERKKLSGRLYGKSVTELEMLIGMLADKRLLSHSFVCIKDDDSFTAIPSHKKNVYIERNRSTEISCLINTIKEHFSAADLNSHIISYHGKWGLIPGSGQVGFIQVEHFLEPLKELILNTIWEEEDLDNYENTPLGSELELIDSYVAQSIIDYRGRESLINKSIIPHLLGDSGILGKTVKRGLCLIGDSGIGKTSVFCKVYSLLSRVSCKNILLAGIGGLTPKMHDFNDTIQLWTDKLASVIGVQAPLYSSNFNDLCYLCRIALLRGYNPIIMIDSLDGFLPHSLPTDFNLIPSGVTYFITSLPDTAEHYRNTPGLKIVQMPRLSYWDAYRIIKAEMGYKSIPGIRHLLRMRNDHRYAYESPLWLNLAITRICEFDRRDFSYLHKCDSFDNISKAYASVIDGLPLTPGDMFLNLLNKSFDYFNKKTVLPALIILALSNKGEDENELNVILGEKWDFLEFAKARLYFRRFIRISPSNRRMIITHSIIKKAILSFSIQLTTKYQKVYLEYLLKKYSDNYYEWDTQDIRDEIVFQLTYFGSAKILQSISEEFNLGDSFQRLYYFDRGATKRMLNQYIDYYATKDYCCDVITNYLCAIDRYDNQSEDEINFGLEVSRRLINTVIKQLSINRVQKPPVLVGFFNYFSFSIEVYNNHGSIRNLIDLLNQMKKTAKLVRDTYGEQYYIDNSRSLFHFWHTILLYINDLITIRPDHKYSEESIPYMDGFNITKESMDLIREYNTVYKEDIVLANLYRANEYGHRTSIIGERIGETWIYKK